MKKAFLKMLWLIPVMVVSNLENLLGAVTGIYLLDKTREPDFSLLFLNFTFGESLVITPDSSVGYSLFGLLVSVIMMLLYGTYLYQSVKVNEP